MLSGLLLGGCLNLPAAQAQSLLQEVNATFALRLETTCRYQQAVLRPRLPASDYYLAVGQRQFLLKTNLLGAQFMRDVYTLETSAHHDTVSVSKARYAQSNALHRPGQVVHMGAFHNYVSNYFSPLFIEARQFITRQEFSPQDALLLRLDTVRTGQRVWVQNSAADANGDTLACYKMTHAGNWWQMILIERRPNGNRRWRRNTHVTCEWSLNPTLRQVNAKRPSDPDNGYTTYWERTYTTLTDFTETCLVTHPVEILTDKSSPTTVYERWFRQVDATHTRDDYTLPAWEGHAPLSFSIIGLGELP